MSKKTVFTAAMKKLFKSRDLKADAVSLGMAQEDLANIIDGELGLSINNAVLISKLLGADAQQLLNLQTEATLAKIGYVAPAAPRKAPNDGNPSKSPMYREPRNDMGRSSCLNKN